jgi:Acyl-CoA synthetases (AMP-forming)/AMP-acid ligases II
MAVSHENSSFVADKQEMQRWSYTCATSDVPLLGMTIGDLFDQTVARYPDNLALISRHQQLRLTYRELQEQVNLCARALLHAGLQKGDRVGIWSPNCAEWCITQFATCKIGAVLVNINPAYRLHEIEYVLQQAGCKALILAPEFKTSKYIEMVQTLAPELAQYAPGQLIAAKLQSLKTVIHLGQRDVPGMYRWSTFMQMGAAVSAEQLAVVQHQQEFDDAINIQYTSGTTGFPKGATLSHHNILNNGYFVARLQHMTHEDRVCIPVPLYHCFGMVMGNLGCVTHGATMVYPSETFDPLAVLQTIQEERCTSLYGVPTMFIAEMAHPAFASFDYSSLRTGVMAGSPCPIEVMRRVIQHLHIADITICFGMTETSPVSAQTTSDTSLEKRVATVGKVHPHLEIKIIDPASGRIVSLGTPGELCVRGYSVMLGYWHNPEATAQAIDAARWMHTSDLATMDEEGYINIVGRMKDMIIRGGENVYPREIEEFLYTHPKVSDVQVIGVPDPQYGESVVAWVKVREGEALTEEELRDFCRGHIAHYKIPKYIRFTSEYPMTVTGKIQKYVMRQTSIHELGLQEIETA